MGQHPIRYQWLAERYPARRPRILRYWTRLDVRTRRRWRMYSRLSPAGVIRQAFGGLSGEALRVASCESGLDPNATNGQYHGLFQLSAAWRAYFGIGEGYDPRSNARAAAAIHATHGWSPWECQP